MKERELHVKSGAAMSATNTRISTVIFPVFFRGQQIGHLTGDDLKRALNASKFDVVDAIGKEFIEALDAQKTTEILKSNGVNEVYTDLEK